MFCVLSLSAAYPMKIKNLNGNMYLSVSAVDKSKVKLSEEINGTLFDYAWNSSNYKNSYLKLNDKQNLALQYNTKKDVLELTNFSKVIDQIFDFVPIEIVNNVFFIVHKQKCLTWIEKDEKFALKDCNEGDASQKFVIEEKDYVTDDLEIFNENKNIFEEETIHLSQLYNSNKKSLHQLNGVENFLNISQMHMENDARDMMQNIYKLFYDLTSCFVDNKVCTIGGIDLQKAKKSNANYKYTDFETKNACLI
ncbi:hypothetical protein BDAP_001619 [Binucleata daphniae]